jgi:hypothetical protein
VIRQLTVIIAALVTLNNAMAEPTSEAVSISSLRPYSGGNTVFVYATTNLCPKSFYSIDLGSNAGKAAYAAALMALGSGKLVKLEIAGTCEAGVAGSTNLQSVYILQ